MHRSSESIGTIAAALAKAQMELTNPEKSLIGAIGSPFRDEQRTFRYAPLVQRSRHCAQEPRPARDRDGSNHEPSIRRRDLST